MQYPPVADVAGGAVVVVVVVLAVVVVLVVLVDVDVDDVVGATAVVAAALAAGAASSPQPAEQSATRTTKAPTGRKAQLTGGPSTRRRGTFLSAPTGRIVRRSGRSEDQAAVVAAEPEAVGEGGAGRPLAALAGDEIDGGQLGVRRLVVRRWAGSARAASTATTVAASMAPAAPERVTGDALDRGDRRALGAEQLDDRLGLGGVVERGRGPVGVDRGSTSPGRVPASASASSMQETAPARPARGR